MQVRNCRLGMLAMLGFAVQAWVTGKGPIDNAIDHLKDPWGQNGRFLHVAVSFCFCLPSWCIKQCKLMWMHSIPVQHSDMQLQKSLAKPWPCAQWPVHACLCQTAPHNHQQGCCRAAAMLPFCLDAAHPYVLPLLLHTPPLCPLLPFPPAH